MPVPTNEEIRDALAAHGPTEAYRQLVAANNALILGPELGNGLEIARARTAIHEALMADWAEEQRREFGYDRPFAVVALGGTGRREMTPCSDVDFAFLFDDVIEDNPFLMHLQEQILHSGAFRKRCGFSGEALPFNLEDMPELDGKQLNAFVDLVPVYDPDGITPAFRERIRATFDPFEHFLHVSHEWRHHREDLRAPFERLDSFDIKADGLRVFLAAVWTLAGRDFVHSHEIYRALDDPRDLEAYAFLLRIRSFVHLRRGTCSPPTATGSHAEDMLTFDDFVSFGNMLGEGASERERYAFDNEVRSRLLSARRRVDRFARGVIGRALRVGREIRSGSGIVLGPGGLRDNATANRTTDAERSRAALSMLLASQRYGVPINPAELESTFQNAGDWLVPVPELADLFYESGGSLADSFKFLSQLDGAEDRLFPGYGKYETSLDERVVTERETLRGAQEREKLRALEEYLATGLELLAHGLARSRLVEAAHDVSIPLEAALLDTNELAAVRLALKTKRLPETPGDVALREDESLPLYDRFSSGMSGIPLEIYYKDSFKNCGFAEETLELAEFLVAKRRAFKLRTLEGMIGDDIVNDFVSLCGDESRLRALFVFTCADRARWGSEENHPARWFNIRELYGKARLAFSPDRDPAGPLVAAGFSPDQLAILEDFGKDFLDGVYGEYAVRFGSRMVAMVGPEEYPKPYVSILRRGPSLIIAVAARDFPGIAASISGALWQQGIRLRQAHLFSASRYGLVLDFFHLATGSEPPRAEVTAAIVEAVEHRKFVDPRGETAIPTVAENLSLREWRSGLFCLRAETTGDISTLLYELAWKVCCHLGADIHGLAAHHGDPRSYVSVYHSLPPELSLEAAREKIHQVF